MRKTTFSFVLLYERSVKEALMKSNIIRTISFLLAITALSLTACAKSNFNYVETTVPATPVSVPWSNTSEFTYTTSDDSTDRVINFQRNSHINVIEGELYLPKVNMVMRFDPKTGRQTALCTDPLCTHNTLDCPFTITDLTSGVYICGDKILYYGLEGGQTKVLLYSTTDRTTKIMRYLEGDRTVPILIAMEEWYFFVDLVYDEKKDTYIRSLCRQFYDSGEIEVILTEDERRQRTSLRGTDGEVLYLSQNGDTFIVMTADGKEEITRFSMNVDSLISIYNNEYMIYMDGETYELWKTDMDGTNARSLGIKGINYFYLTDNYIYYMKTTDTKRFEYWEDYDNPLDVEYAFVEYQTIYRCDHNGENEEVVFVNTVGDDVLSLNKFTSFVVEGNYLYGVFNYHDFTEDKVITTNSRLSELHTYCRIDCTTGEIYYIEVK